MSKLVIVRGLPASGKTTVARGWVADWPIKRARVNRDDIREMLNEGYYEKGVTEGVAVAVRDSTISYLLSKGMDVISDDTNLPDRTVRDLAKIARKYRAEVAFIDMTDVPVDTCVEREARRGKLGDGEAVIRSMYAKYIRGKDYPLTVPELAPPFEPEPYTAIPGTKPAVIVDIDGTVAKHAGRSPYDMTRVHEDEPHQDIIDLVEILHNEGNQIIFLSGRTEDARDSTRVWLEMHAPYLFHDPLCWCGQAGEPYCDLYMRAVGDTRNDSVVKTELFDKYLRSQYNVRYVLDDRNSVVENWRKMGLRVLHVADGDF